jgi:photosystem II stability/assembly factor-like uncharacterized protein
VILLAVALVVGAPGADAGAWIRSTPGAGGAFTQASASGDTVWVGADIAGFYRTMNGGQSWTAIGTATPVSGAAVAVKPRDARHVVAGVDGSSSGDPFRVSSDATRPIPTWKKPKAAPGWPNFITWGRGRRVWAAGRASASKAGGPRIWTSPDDGATWTTVRAAGLPADACPIEIVCHPTKDSDLYLVSGADKFRSNGRKALYKSSDLGARWSEIGAAFLGGKIQDMAISPAFPSTLYATTGDVGTDRDVVVRSTDSGRTWSEIGRKHTGNVIVLPDGRVLLVNVERPGTSEKCGPQSECGVWEWASGAWRHVADTSDWESGWTRSVAWSFGRNLYGRSKTIAQDPLRPERLWWVTSRFVFVSDDGGATFRSTAFTRAVGDGAFAGRGLDNVSLMSLDGNGPNVLAGYYDNGLWARVESAEAWRAWNDAAATSNVSGAGKGWAGAGGNASTCLQRFVGGRVKTWVANGETRDKQLLLWSDEATPSGGRSWRKATGVPANVFVSGLSFDAKSPAMYVTADGHVYKSTDEGQHWKKLEPGPYQVHFTAVDRVNGKRVYAGGRSGIWFSEDGGATWRQPSGPLRVIKPGSCDSDTSLGKMCWNGIHDVWAAPREGAVWAALYGESSEGDGGFYRSTDGGRTWVRKLAKPFAQCVTGSGDTIWAGQSKLTNASRSNVIGGLLRSTDGGESWSAVDMGPGVPGVNRLAMHGRQVWAGVPGQGALYLNPDRSTKGK